MALVQWLFLTASIIFLLTVLWAIRRGSLQMGYSLLWLLMTSVVIVVSIVPKLLKYLACLTGIKTPAFALILTLIGGMLLIMFQLSVVISRHNEKIRKLTEELTLLRSERRDGGKDRRDG